MAFVTIPNPVGGGKNGLRTRGTRMAEKYMQKVARPKSGRPPRKPGFVADCPSRVLRGGQSDFSRARTKTLYALLEVNIFISSADGPYMPGTSTLFMRR